MVVKESIQGYIDIEDALWPLERAVKRLKDDESEDYERVHQVFQELLGMCEKANERFGEEDWN